MGLVQLDDAHRELVHRLRDEAEQWLAAKGTDQYRGHRAPLAHASLDRLLDAGAFWGWEVDGDVKAVAVLDEADRDFWTAEEAAQRASYVGRLMVAEHGRDWGAQLIDALAVHEQERGQTALRLDCWRTNTELHNYYRRHGFRHVRTVEAPGRQSGALFEREIA